MWPALRVVLNDNPFDDRLFRVFGSSPRAAIVILIAVSLAAGLVFERWGPTFLFKESLDWPAVFAGAVFAYLMRRYLFGLNEATEEDFPWLAAALIPAAAALVFLSIVRQLIFGVDEAIADAPWFVSVGPILLLVTKAAGVAAAFTIAVAALCYRRNWLLAIRDLAIQLLIFKLMVGVTLFVLVDVGIVGPILAALIESIFAYRFPAWLADFFDQLSYAVILGVIYFAIIGATWTACRQGFASLLADGDVNILHTIETMTRTRKKKKEKKKKAK